MSRKQVEVTIKLPLCDIQSYVCILCFTREVTEENVNLYTKNDRHRQTDTHESENRGHPFRVSGIFPSTDHQGSVQRMVVTDRVTVLYN